MTQSSNHAIVFGASGIIGWAIVDQILRSYPDATSFSRVTAVTNRPIKLTDSCWPTSGSDQPSLNLVSGVDLRHGDGSALSCALKEKVPNVEDITHVYYTVFNASSNGEEEEVATNRRMFQGVIDALGALCPKLRFVAFPGGSRGYGIYAPGGTFKAPLTESLADDLPSDQAKLVVYPAYREVLRQASTGKQWTWCEVCPDAIIGFTPNGSQFSLALHWAQYLSLYAFNHGIGPYTQNESASTEVQVPFPGSAAGATSLHTPVSSKTIARLMIFASLHPETCGGGQLFNIADNETPLSYGELWPHLAKWFGLVGTVPGSSQDGDEDGKLAVGQLPQTMDTKPPGEYVAAYKDVFAKLGREKAATAGVGFGNRQLDSVGYWLTFDRQLSLQKVRATGFEGDLDPVQGWLEAFEMFRSAGMIL